MNLWIARDASNALFIYEEKPHLNDGVFMPVKGTFLREIPFLLYPDVTHQNSPQMLVVEK